MPVSWTENNLAPVQSGASFGYSADDPPVFTARITPNRSLSRRGFAKLMLLIWGLASLPLLALLGTSALWIMLGFLSVALAALWYFIERNYHDGTLYEELLLWPDHIAVNRYNPRSDDQNWHANLYWTSLHMRPEGGPVENYLTLRGNARTIELGAFLSPSERHDLYEELARKLARAKTFQHAR